MVLNPSSGDVFELSAIVWEVAEALDGISSAVQVAERIDVDAEQVIEVVRRLEGLDLLQDPAPKVVTPLIPAPQWTRGPVPSDFGLKVHPDAHFLCVGAGTCCQRSYVINVDDRQVQGLRAAAPEGRDPVMLWPGAPGEPWGHVLDNDEGCTFLTQDRGCQIHEADFQPAACQVFPLVFARVDETVVVSLSHRCGCGAGGHGVALSEDLDEILRRLALSPHVPVVPKAARLDSGRVVDGSEAAELMMQVALHEWPLEDPKSIWHMLQSTLACLINSADEDLAPKPEWQYEDLSELRLRLAEGAQHDLRVAFMGGRAVEPSDLKARLALADIPDEPEGTAELSRYLRDHLFGLRPFQQATLTQGLALMALMLDGVQVPGASMTQTRTQIMAWDDVTPQKDMRGLLAVAGSAATEDAQALLDLVTLQLDGS